MNIDTSELALNVQWNLDLFTIVKKRLYDFFYRDVTDFHQVPLTPLFSVTQHYERCWDPPPPKRDVIIEQPLSLEPFSIFWSNLYILLEVKSHFTCSELNLLFPLPSENFFLLRSTYPILTQKISIKKSISNQSWRFPNVALWH